MSINNHSASKSCGNYRSYARYDMVEWTDEGSYVGRLCLYLRKYTSMFVVVVSLYVLCKETINEQSSGGERESKTLERRQQEFTTFGSLHRLSENIKPLEKANPQQIMGGWSDQIN